MADNLQLLQRHRACGGPNRADIARAREQALRCCQSCPVLTQCSDWFDSLPAWDRPRGVVAGQVITKRSSRTPW